MSRRLQRYLSHLASFAGRQAVGMVVNVLMTGYLYARLGKEGYGIWAIALSLGSYMGLVDLNTNASVVKYTAELEAKGRRDELVPMVNAGVQILFGFSFGLLALGLIGLPWLTPLIFKTTIYSPKQMMLLSGLCLFSFALLQTGNVYQQVLQGLLRQHEVNAIGAAGIIINAAAACSVVALGLDVVWLGAANLLGTLTVLLATRLRVARLVPELPWFDLRSTAQWRQALLHFSAGSYAFTLWGWFYFTGPKMLLANLLGPVSVGFYDVGTRVAAIGRNLVQNFSQYLIPFMSETGAKEGAKKLQALQVQAVTYLWMLGLGVGGYFLAVREPLVQRWLHSDEPQLLTAMFWVLLEYMFGGLVMPWVHFALAEGRLKHAWPFLAYIIPGCVLGPWVGLHYGGFTGFLVGGALANSAGTAFFYVLALRERHMPMWPLMGRIAKVCLGWGTGWLALAAVPWPASILGLALAGLLWALVLGSVWALLGLIDKALLQRLPGRAA